MGDRALGDRPVPSTQFAAHAGQSGRATVVTRFGIVAVMHGRARAESPARFARIACYAIAMRWGVHPVLEAALAHLDETAVPEEIERSLPPRGTLSTRALVEIAALSIAHARPRASRAQRAEFERLAALVDRWLSEARAGDQPWHRDLHAARRDFEHGRGALKIAARAAEIAAADLLRSAPGVGPEAVALTCEAVDRTARLLANDEAALHAFVLALCARVGELQPPSRR